MPPPSSSSFAVVGGEIFTWSGLEFISVATSSPQDFALSAPRLQPGARAIARQPTPGGQPAIPALARLSPCHEVASPSLATTKARTGCRLVSLGVLAPLRCHLIVGCSPDASCLGMTAGLSFLPPWQQGRSTAPAPRRRLQPGARALATTGRCAFYIEIDPLRKSVRPRMALTRTGWPLAAMAFAWASAAGIPAGASIRMPAAPKPSTTQ